MQEPLTYQPPRRRHSASRRRSCSSSAARCSAVQGAHPPAAPASTAARTTPSATRSRALIASTISPDAALGHPPECRHGPPVAALRGGYVHGRAEGQRDEGGGEEGGQNSRRPAGFPVRETSSWRHRTLARPLAYDRRHA